MTISNASNQHGKNADKPREIPKSGWWHILKRIGSQVSDDHVQIIAAGVAFYLFLALFPAIAALLSIYGIAVEPAQAEEHINQLSSFMPKDVQETISQIATQISSRPTGSLGFGLVISVVLSLWSANKGTKALFEGLNIVYDESDDRGYFKTAVITYLFTLVVMVAGIIALALVAVVPAVIENLELSKPIALALNVLRWPVVALLFATLLILAYRIAPDRDNPRWRWVGWGSALATLLWLAGSALFSIYVDNFGKFGETYGSFAAVIILMLWFFLSAFVILLGGEVNSEMEHQTAKDTTVGPDEPMGARGAYHADHVADSSDN